MTMPNGATPPQPQFPQAMPTQWSFGSAQTAAGKVVQMHIVSVNGVWDFFLLPDEALGIAETIVRKVAELKAGSVLLPPGHIPSMKRSDEA